MSIRARMETAGIRACIEDMRAIDNAPERAKERLDRVLDDAFVASQWACPVESGALRASGHRYSHEPSPGVWEGVITYGEGLEYATYAFNHETNGARMDAAIYGHEEQFEEVLRDVFTER